MHKRSRLGPGICSAFSASVQCIVPISCKSIIGGCNRKMKDHGNNTTEPTTKTKNRTVWPNMWTN